MIFIIEGPDGAGKTTLIKAIREQAKLASIHCHFLSSSGPPRSSTHIQKELEWLNHMPKTMNLFCDRHRAISEPIYGSILRGQNLVDPSYSLTRRASADVFIYCRPPVDTIKTNLANNPQLQGVPDRIDDIVKAYDALFDIIENQDFFPVMRYDYTIVSQDAFVQSILHWCIA
jgi:hypothetical protein